MAKTFGNPGNSIAIPEVAALRTGGLAALVAALGVQFVDVLNISQGDIIEEVGYRGGWERAINC